MLKKSATGKGELSLSLAWVISSTRSFVRQVSTSWAHSSRWWQYCHLLGTRGGWIHMPCWWISQPENQCSCFWFQFQKLKEVVTNLSSLFVVFLWLFGFLWCWFICFVGGGEIWGIFPYPPLVFCSFLYVHSHSKVLFPLTSKGCLMPFLFPGTVPAFAPNLCS